MAAVRQALSSSEHAAAIGQNRRKGTTDHDIESRQFWVLDFRVARLAEQQPLSRCYEPTATSKMRRYEDTKLRFASAATRFARQTARESQIQAALDHELFVSAIPELSVCRPQAGGDAGVRLASGASRILRLLRFFESSLLHVAVGRCQRCCATRSNCAGDHSRGSISPSRLISSRSSGEVARSNARTTRPTSSGCPHRPSGTRRQQCGDRRCPDR